MKLNPYLHFDGNCKEAFEFYVKHLGAKMVMCMTYADAPPQAGGPGEGCPPPPSDRIMHARLQLGDVVIMGSDVPAGYFREQAGFYVNLGLTEVKEAERIYQALSENGQVFMPLEETFWAKKFAMLQDRFGVPWMINVEKAGG
jgi:PhnB protein